jgi:hypothetical protein
MTGETPRLHGELMDRDEFEKVTLRWFVVLMVIAIAAAVLIAVVRDLRTALAG